MSDRIHRALDGDLDPGELDPRERAEAEVYRSLVRETLHGIPGGAAPDLAPEVLRRIGALPEHGPAAAETSPSTGRRPGLANLLQRLWQPRPVTLRPALAAAMAVALLVVGGVLGRQAAGGAGEAALAEAVPVQQGGTAVVRDGAGARTVRVRFRLDAPAASNVALAGDFTGWAPTVRLEQEAPGVWSAVVALEPGVHDYAFVIDGSEWVLDPLAQAVSDGFGGRNSRVAVLVQEGQS